LINDPDTFEDASVEKEVHSMLRSMGVSVQNGYEFYEIYGNPCRGIKFRQKASNYDELEELIKKKRAEIVLRSQEMSNKVQD
jgi:hypothetical protein